jgi:hypothetical protein
MRYGKKLALCLQDEQNSTKPFISHKAWREVLSVAAREHRGGCDIDVIVKYDAQFLALLRSDVEQISKYCQQVERDIATSLEELTVKADQSGITLEGPVARMALEIHKTLIESSYPLLHNATATSLRSLWSQLATLVSEVCNTFNDLAWKFQQHSNYLEVNIAGFRKTIKQRGKQIPVVSEGEFFEDYKSLGQPATVLVEKFLALHSQLNHSLQLFAPGAQLFSPKLGTETLDACQKKSGIDSELIQLLLSMLPRE